MFCRCGGGGGIKVALGRLVTEKKRGDKKKRGKRNVGGRSRESSRYKCKMTGLLARHAPKNN